jgi:radical SAM superfamily enzyme YgiQ (UPF0313 family)
MSKNVLLVYPKIPDNTYWSFSHAMSFVGKKANIPPIGLATVAAMLPDHYNVKLVDMNVDSLVDADIKWADAVFTSSMVVQQNSLEQVITRANRLNTTVVAGGPFPSQYFDLPVMQGIDHFVLGEAESGVLKLFLDDFEQGKAKKTYARVPIRTRKGEQEIDQQYLEELTEHFRQDDYDIRVATARPDLETSPIPRFDLLNTKAYTSMAVQLSRGCPHACDFCDITALFGHKPRLKSSKQIVAELETILNTGYRGALMIVDDNFIGKKREVKEVLKNIASLQQKNNYPLNLFTEADISLAKDEELMKLMQDAGFDMVFIGLESPDIKVLKGMGKGVNTRADLLQDVRTIQSYGMEVTAGLIVGTDNDPPDICDRIFDFCQEAGIPTAMVGLLTAIKGSKLYARLEKEGRLLESYSGDNTHGTGFNFEQTDAARVVQEYRILLDRLYDKSGHNYYVRCKTLLENLGERRKAARDIGLTEIRAFGMSLLGQGLVRSYSQEYRKFVNYVRCNHKELLPEAIAMAIKGHHLRMITKTALKESDAYAPGQLYNHLRDELHRFGERLEDGYEGIRTTCEEGAALRIEEAKQLGADSYKDLRREANTFLKQARAKLEVLPSRHQRQLSEAYDSLAQSVAAIAPQPMGK